jgi:hypothetical protein
MKNIEVQSSSSPFAKTLLVATSIPGVRVDRAAYLRRSLLRYCTEDQIRTAIEYSPARAAIPSHIISKIADASIKHETIKVTSLSAAAGVPGGFALLATIPADTAQYLAHLLRIAQKLAYLYSWPDFFGKDGDEADDETQNLLTLFVGVMFGVQAANKAVGVVAAKLAEQTARQLPNRALTKGVVYPIVKKVAARLGEQMTKGVFAKGVAKAIPIAGGVVSGAFTLATFVPMSKRLKRHLASLETTRPSGLGDEGLIS